MPERWVVLYDYEAQQNDELTLRAGQVLVVIAKHNDGWWKGRLEMSASKYSYQSPDKRRSRRQADNASGMFPYNYVRPIGRSPAYRRESQEPDEYNVNNKQSDIGGGGGGESESRGEELQAASPEDAATNVLLDDDLQSMLRGSLDHLGQHAKAFEATSVVVADKASGLEEAKGDGQQPHESAPAEEAEPAEPAEPPPEQPFAEAMTQAAAEVAEMSAKIEEEVTRDGQLSNDVTDAATAALSQVETVLQTIVDMPPSISISLPPPELDVAAAASSKYAAQSPEMALALRLFAALSAEAKVGPLGHRSVSWEGFLGALMEEASPAMDQLQQDAAATSLQASARGYITREQAAVTRRFLKQPAYASPPAQSPPAQSPPPLASATRTPAKGTAGGGSGGGGSSPFKGPATATATTATATTTAAVAAAAAAEKAPASDAGHFRSRLPVRRARLAATPHKQDAPSAVAPAVTMAVAKPAIEPTTSEPNANAPESATKLSQLRSRIPRRRRPRKTDPANRSNNAGVITPKVQSVINAYRPGLSLLFDAYAQPPSVDGEARTMSTANFVKLCRDFGLCDALLSRQEATTFLTESCLPDKLGVAREDQFIVAMVHSATAAYRELPMMDLSQKVSLRLFTCA